MSVDTSGEWWVGSEPADIRAFLEAYTEDGYPIAELRLATCACGSVEFAVEADANEGGARRTCAACGAEHFVCDSEEYWDEAEPEAFACVSCPSEKANVGCGFALRDDGEVRWIYVGVRCAGCGILGCMAEWKIDYSPSKQLLDQA